MHSSIPSTMIINMLSKHWIQIEKKRSMRYDISRKFNNSRYIKNTEFITQDIF